jgi:hypothetical protein
MSPINNEKAGSAAPIPRAATVPIAISIKSVVSANLKSSKKDTASSYFSYFFYF